MGMRPDSKTKNYRTAGKRTDGKLKRAPGPAEKYHAAQGKTASGAPPVKPAVRQPPSIPSRFRVAVSVEPHERKGFGTQVKRFAGDSTLAGPVPGPGSYYKPRNHWIRDPSTCGSVSKKGFGGGFISKTTRFTDRGELESALAPGPGAYDPLTAQPLFNPNNQAPTSSMFAPAKKSRLEDALGPVGTVTPAPGEYRPFHHEGRFSMRHKRRQMASFKSTSRSRQDTEPVSPGADENGPGTYEVGAASDALHRFGKNEEPNAAFKSQSLRGIDAEIRAKRAQPGPGTYEVDQADLLMRTDVSSRLRSSAAFQNNARRFGGPQSALAAGPADVPGPGAYGVSAVGSIANAGTSSLADGLRKKSGYGFGSGSKRNTVDIKREAPGPAFYTPSAPPKKSFLMNSKMRWV